MGIVPTFTYGSLDLTAPPFAVEFGTDLGAPESVTQVMASLLADGEIETETRRSNRTLVIPILIDDSDFQALADAEQALVAEADRFRNTFTVDPGDGYGPATVFDTFQGRAVFNRVDEQEQAGVRRWTLTLRALPHGRSTTKITDSAGTPPSSGGTVVDSCQSTSGWSAYSDPSTSAPVISVDSTTFYEGTGSIKITAGVYNGNAYPGFTLARSTDVHAVSIATGAGGYLSVAIKLDWAGFVGNPSTVEICQRIGGGASTAVAVSGTEALTDGFVRYSWPVAAGVTVTEIQFHISQYYDAIDQPKPAVHYDAITLSTSATTDHQIIKHLDVKGSARTPGSLHVAAPSDGVALGQVLVMTVPDSEIAPGFVPDARRWTTSGTTTTDTTALHGSYFTITSSYSGSPTFDVPVTILAPGPYSVVALAYPNTDISLTVEAQLKIGATVTGPTSEAGISLPTPPAGWQMVCLGTVYLPPLPMQNADSTASVRLRLKGSGRIADVFVIPLAADFSIVDCGSGSIGAAGASSHLWLDSPDAKQPQGGWWRGPAASRGLARSAWPDVKKPAQHTFPAGGLTACVVATGAAGPTLTLEYWPAFHTNANL